MVQAALATIQKIRPYPRTEGERSPEGKQGISIPDPQFPKTLRDFRGYSRNAN